MKTEKVLNIIEKVATTESDSMYFSLDEVLVALMHAYYYVKPEDTERFMFMLNDMVERGERSGLSDYKEYNGMFALRDCNRSAIAKLGSYLVKDCFNWKYYTAQLKTLDFEEKYDKELLRKYVYQLDKEQMKNFLIAVITLKNKETGEYCFFSDDNRSFVDLELCYADENPDPSQRVSQNPSHFIENLCLKTIADTLVGQLDRHNVMAGHLAKMMYYYNDKMARDYLEFALYCEEKLDMNPFDDKVGTFQGFIF
jgi:hypothetical protein